MNRFFGYLQFLVIPFSLAAIYFIAHGTIVQDDKIIQNIGSGVLCMGIAFAFSSMGDITEVSKKEEILFRDTKRFRRFILRFTWFGFSILMVCILFISMKWIGRTDFGKQYYSLGLNLFPNVIAIFFIIKQLLDKKQYYDLKSEMRITNNLEPEDQPNIGIEITKK